MVETLDQMRVTKNNKTKAIVRIMHNQLALFGSGMLSLGCARMMSQSSSTRSHMSQMSSLYAIKLKELHLVMASSSFKMLMLPKRFSMSSMAKESLALRIESSNSIGPPTVEELLEPLLPKIMVVALKIKDAV